jgi:hypothetical protein
MKSSGGLERNTSFSKNNKKTFVIGEAKDHDMEINTRKINK